MFILRIVLAFVGLLLAGLVITWAITRNRRYLRIAWLAIQLVLILAVVLGLLYVFERVLLA